MCIGVCLHSTDTHLGNKNDVKCGRGQLCRGREVIHGRKFRSLEVTFIARETCPVTADAADVTGS
ncbi:hypothetical protein L798_01100 [Zootermopsis nevadensis]|uniref:Uncharacterized protein n=1 Tax=Zootermopsis nevadensis TaxID=136037 RepID=A0A067QX03_ZOONE|nr:hypothetical protein L798_01100 [Zootermopsis nevadensis]